MVCKGTISGFGMRMITYGKREVCASSNLISPVCKVTVSGSDMGTITYGKYEVCVSDQV